RVAEIVLLAQFVGDAFSRRIDVARIANDLGTAATIVRQVAQRDNVDAIVSWPASRIAAALTENLSQQREAPTWPASPGKWIRYGRRTPRGDRRRSTPNDVVAFAVDAHRIDDHFALANLLLEIADADMARRVVAVGNDHERLFLVSAACRHRDRIRNRVVQRRSAFRHDSLKNS